MARLRIMKMLLWYLLLKLQWMKCGDVQEGKRRSVKRLAVYRALKTERLKWKAFKKFLKTRKRRRWWVRPIFLDREIHGAWYSLVPTMKEFDRDAYFNFLRMTPESFDWLLERVAPIITKTSARQPISAGERLCVTLRYLASGTSFTSLSYLFRIAEPTISKIIFECTAAIWCATKNEVFEELNENCWRKKAAEFRTMWNFPMCVGAIDGKHCFVQKFAMRGSENYNYKYGHSVVLFAVADAKYKFIVVDVGSRGRESDGGVFERSDFGKCFNSRQLRLPPAAFNEDIGCLLPYVFVGDDAFPLDTHLMKPFDGSPDYKPEETLFNNRCSRARRVVENAFGILAARFRVLRTNIIASDTLVQNIIHACTALHNLHLQREDSIPPNQRVYCPPGFGDVYYSNGHIKRGRWRNESKPNETTIFYKLTRQEQPAMEMFESAENIREDFMHLFVKRPVPWQFDLVG